MLLNRLNSKINREERNRLNENFDIIENNLSNVVSYSDEAFSKSTEALNDSKKALVKSEEANSISQNVNTRLDNLIIESGTSDAEVIASRNDVLSGENYVSLPQRLDEQHSNLSVSIDDNTKNLKERGINVKQSPFNALADGITNETELMNEIIDYALSINIKKIIIPVGSTMVVGDIEIPKEFTISGGGYLKKNASSKGILKVIGDNVTLESIKFYSTDYSTSVGFLVDTVAENTHIRYCEFNGYIGSSEYSAIRTSAGSKNTNIYHNNIYNCAYFIFCQNGSENININYNNFKGGRTKGVVSNGVYSVEPVGDAIKLSRGFGGKYIKVHGNNFDGIYRDCIDAFTSGNYVDFSHNICRDIDVNVADIKTIYRNPDDSSGTTDPNNPSSDFIFSNNTILNVGIGQNDSRVFNISHENYVPDDDTYDNLIYSVQRVLIESNKIHASTRYGIVVNKCRNISILNNEIKDVTERNIYITGNADNIDVFNNEIFISEDLNNVHGIVSNTIDSNKLRIKQNKIYSASNSLLINGIWVQGRDIEIEENSIYNARTGINLYNIENSVVERNKTYNCSIAGIRLGESGSSGSISKMSLKGNYAKDCVAGIRFGNAPNKIVFADNVANNCNNPFMNSAVLTNSVERNNDII